MRRAILVLLLAACSNKPSQKECEGAADKMLAIFASPRLAPGSSASSELNSLSDSWKKSLQHDPSRAVLVDTCRKKMTKDHVECIQKASDERSLARCFSG